MPEEPTKGPGRVSRALPSGGNACVSVRCYFRSVIFVNALSLPALTFAK